MSEFASSGFKPWWLQSLIMAQPLKVFQPFLFKKFEFPANATMMALTHLLVCDANSFHDDGRQLSERRACDGVRRRVFGEVEPVRRMKKL